MTTTLQAPPDTVVDWDFSLSRSATMAAGRGKFRWRLPEGGEWLCDRLAGQCDIVGVDGQKGNLTIRCQVVLVSENGLTTAYCYPPDDEFVDEYVPDPSQPSHESHWRLCYFRAEERWRLRDERSGQLWFVNGYRGRINANWLDNGTHIFHDGVVEVDTENVAHFKA